MANPIENKIIAQALTEINTIGKAIEKTFQGVAEQAKNIGDNAEDIVKNLDFKKSKDVEELNKQIQQLTKEVDNLTSANKTRKKASEEVTKQEKLLLKLQKDQTETSKELAVEIEELRLERSKDSKAAKEQAKENKGLTNTLDKQRKRLNELQKELTNATLEGRQNEASVKAQKEEFEKLFTAITNAEQEFGNFRRQVGNYEKASEGALRATEKLGRQLNKLKNASIVLGGVIAGGGLVGKALKSNEEGLDDLRIASEALDQGINSLLSSTLKGLKEGLDATGGSVSGVLDLFTILGGAIDGVATGAKEFLGVIKSQAELTTEVIKFEKALQDSASGEKGLLVQLAEATALFEKNSAEADRNTRSLEERLKFIELASDASETAFSIERDIAQRRVDLFKRQLDLNKNNGTVTRQILQQLTQANTDLIDVESRGNQQRIQNSEVRLQIIQDQTELELDILIDSFDTQRTLNERIIADSRKSFGVRNKLLEETKILSEESFSAQTEAVVKLAKAEAEANNEAFDAGKFREDLASFISAEATAQEELRRQLNLSEIISTRSLEISRERRIVSQELLEAEQELKNEQLESSLTLKNVQAQEEAINKLQSGRSKDQINRAKILNDLRKEQTKNTIENLKAQLDAIKGTNEERKAQLEEAQTDLKFAKIDLENNLIDAQQRLANFNEATATDLEKAEVNALKSRIEFNKLRIESDEDVISKSEENIENSATKELEIREKLNSSIIQSDTETVNEQIKLRQDFSKSVVNAAQQTADILNTISEKNIANIDSEIAAIERREDALRSALENGSELAGESLTKLDSERKKKEAEQREEREKQARREVFIAAARLVSESGGLAGAAQNLAGLKAIVDKIMSGFGFHDGGYTGDGGEWSTAGVVHKGEFVNTAKQVDNYGMKGWNASDFDKAVDSGYFNQFNSDLTSDYLKYDTVKPVVNSTLDTSKIVNRLERVEDAVLKTIESKPKHDKQWDEERKEMLYILETKNRIEKERRKSFKY
jgi:hypothetical protein